MPIERRKAGRSAVVVTLPSLVRLSALVGVLLLPWVTPPAALGQTLIFDRFERAAGAPAGWTQLSSVSSAATFTPTSTATTTPTSTATTTPTATRIPDGGSCDQPTDCVSGNCVDDTCCADPSCAPGESCNNPGNVGECSPDPVAPAPDLSPSGIVIVLALLVGVGGVAMRRRYSAPR